MTEGLGLRAKLALAFALAASVPLVAIEQLTARRMRAEFDRRMAAEFEAQRRFVESQLAREGARIAEQVGRAAAGFGLRDALLGFEASGGGAAHAALIAAVREAAAVEGLPLLTLLGADDRVLASAEEPERFDVSDARGVALASARPGHPFVARSLGLEARGPALLASAACRGERAEYWLVGGTALEPDLLGELRLAEDVALLLVTAEGVRAAPSAAGRAALAAVPAGAAARAEVVAALEAAGWRAGEARLRDVGQAEPAALVLATSLAPVAAIVSGLERTFLVLLGLGLALAFLLAWLVARLWTRPIEQLVRGFDRVAAGDLEVRLAIRRGDEIGRMAEAFHAMTRDLADSRARLIQAERVAAWREIARQLAHEIKNPLSPIALSMETLRRAHRTGHAAFPALLEECTRTVLEEVERLRRTVQEFSDFARMPRPRLVEADFHEAIRGVQSLYAGAGSAHRFELDLAPEGGRFTFDPDQANRLVLNLVKNAIEAQPDGGVVRIATAMDAQRGRFVLTVADSGPGIDEAAAARLFEPYVTSKQGGSGLGLAIVRRIAEEHGGAARLENPGQPGARFRVELALRPETGPASADR